MKALVEWRFYPTLSVQKGKSVGIDGMHTHILRADAAWLFLFAKIGRDGVPAGLFFTKLLDYCRDFVKGRKRLRSISTLKGRSAFGFVLLYIKAIITLEHQRVGAHLTPALPSSISEKSV